MSRPRELFSTFTTHKILKVEPIPNIQRFCFTLINHEPEPNVITSFYLPMDYTLVLARRIDVLATQHVFGGTLGTKENNHLVMVRVGGGKPSQKDADYEIEARQLIVEYQHALKEPFHIVITNGPGTRTEEGRIKPIDEENQIELEMSINADEAQRLSLAIHFYIQDLIKRENVKKIFQTKRSLETNAENE
ncbi:MAG: hypothetical protein ACFFDI_10390 [Promethearchaeota archaeon]